MIIIMNTLFEEMKDLFYRWEKHKKFLKILKDTNIDNDIYIEWEELINNTFKNKLKSKL